MGIYGPSLDRRVILAIGGAVAALVLIILFLSLLPSGPVDIRLSKDVVEPGDAFQLFVTVRNTGPEDVESVAVDVRAIDPGVSVSPQRIGIPVIEKGGERTVRFDVNTSTDLLPGVYFLEVSVKIGEKEEVRRKAFRVK